MLKWFALIALVAGLMVFAAMATGAREVAVSVVISVHLLSVAMLTVLERRIGGRGSVAGIAERNRRRISWFVIVGGVMILAAAFFPITHNVLAFLVLASAATAFNLGAFAVEAVSVASQWRLLCEMRVARSTTGGCGGVFDATGERPEPVASKTPPQPPPIF